MVSKVHGTNAPMRYISGALTYFCWNVKDHYLASVSYIELRAAKVWYVYTLQNMNSFERVSFRYLFNPEYLNNCNVGGWQILIQEETIFIPGIPQKFGTTLSFHRDIRRKGSFGVVALRENQVRFNSGYNVASAVKYTHSSWNNYERSVSKIPITCSMPGLVGKRFE